MFLKSERKFQNFDQNQRLTPIFYVEYNRTIYQGLFLRKTNRKFQIFDKTHGLNPLEK